MKVRICAGTKCMFYGADNLLDRMNDLAETLHDFPGVPESATLEIEMIPCDGTCRDNSKVAPLVWVDDVRMERASSPEVMETILNGLQEA